MSQRTITWRQIRLVFDVMSNYVSEIAIKLLSAKRTRTVSKWKLADFPGGDAELGSRDIGSSLSICVHNNLMQQSNDSGGDTGKVRGPL